MGISAKVQQIEKEIGNSQKRLNKAREMLNNGENKEKIHQLLFDITNNLEYMKRNL